MPRYEGSYPSCLGITGIPTTNIADLLFAAQAVRQFQNSIQRTPTFDTFTEPGTIAAGAQSLTIANIGTDTAQVLGNDLLPGAGISLAANGDDTLGPISYVASATAILSVVGLI